MKTLSKKQQSCIAQKALSLITSETTFKHSAGGFGISSQYAYNNGKQIQFYAFGSYPVAYTIQKLIYSNGTETLVVQFANLNGNFGINLASRSPIQWNYNMA